ncbi:MAG: RsmE family RNA methyltransferase [Spirochaetaceae bacterium]|jgi:RsmE family RNA methyltransferase|nr:RsmE family RNA methyltransferase [Spirochaetaceae bacterium]
MNLILFEEAETENPLKKRDARTVHLLKTLHKKEGDEFDAGILGGKLGKGRIEAFTGEGGVVFSLCLTVSPPPRLPVTVAAGFPRPIQTRRLLRDLSNMGVRAIHLVSCELGDRNYLKTTLLSGGGARAALIEGAVQARDTALPELDVFSSVKDWLDKLPPEGGISVGGLARIACDNVEPDGTFGEEPPGTGPFTLAVGPERGWSDRERRRLADAGFRRLSLGCRALRTETACVAAVSALATAQARSACLRSLPQTPPAFS